MTLHSYLFTPGNQPRRMAKALSAGAHAVILDLEDACPVAEKAAARSQVVEALSAPRRCRGYVRVNGLGTEFGFRDLLDVVRPGVDGIVLPKVESRDDVILAHWLMHQVEREHQMRPGEMELVPLVETAAGISAISHICSASTRIKRLAFGSGDLTIELDIKVSRDEAELSWFRAQLVLASRVAGLLRPVDAVWASIDDTDGFAKSVERGRNLGFGGKLCIHPKQVDVTNNLYAPHQRDLDWALKVVSAFETAESEGRASISLDGQLVDYPIYSAARRLVDAAAGPATHSVSTDASKETVGNDHA